MYRQNLHENNLKDKIITNHTHSDFKISSTSFLSLLVEICLKQGKTKLKKTSSDDSNTSIPLISYHFCINETE